MKKGPHALVNGWSDARTGPRVPLGLIPATIGLGLLGAGFVWFRRVSPALGVARDERGHQSKLNGTLGGLLVVGFMGLWVGTVVLSRKSTEWFGKA